MTGDRTPKVRQARGKYLVMHECRQTEDLANAFLERIRVRGLSENTAAAYAYDLVSLFRWLRQAHKDVFTFSREDLFEYLKSQADSGSRPRSINRRLVVCELFLHFLQERSLSIHATHQNAQALGSVRHQGPRTARRSATKPRVKVPYTLVEPLNTKEVNQLLAGVRFYRDSSIILLMTLVGLRRHEILSIEVGDIDFERNFMRIRGKGRKERAMPMPASVTALLQKYLSYERPRTARSPTMFLVLQGAQRGQPMTAAGLRSFFRKRRRSSQVTHANPHRLRHTFAYSMVKAGVSIAVLQKMLGHARYTTTLRYVCLGAGDVAEQYHQAMDVLEKKRAARDTDA